MTGLTLTLKEPPRRRVDMSPLSAVTHLTLAETAALKLWSGRRRLRVDELFDIQPGDPSRLTIERACSRLDYIGREASEMDIKVEGDAGAYLGMGLKSGSIEVTGNSGIFSACQMRGGTIRIDGDAGDFLGAALPGNKRGMRGGVVLVKGNAGDRCGDEMRRGIILVEGNVGHYCASRMIAGTIAVMGTTGEYPGYALRRGTLLLWQRPRHIPPTFGDCGTHTLSYLPLWFAALRPLGSRFSEPGNTFNRVHRYGGDLGSVGRGEILVRVD